MQGKHYQKEELKNAIFSASQIHCSLYYFLKEVMAPEWSNWKTFLLALLSEEKELAEFLRLLPNEKVRQKTFGALKSLLCLSEEDWSSPSINFIQSATLLYCYYYRKGSWGQELAVNSLVLAEMMDQLHVYQIESPAWLVEKIYLSIGSHSRLKLKVHPALKHPRSPFFDAKFYYIENQLKTKKPA